MKLRGQSDAQGAAAPSLTGREEQILKLVAEGLSNKEIDRKLNLQEKTVKYYLSTVFQKLNVRNRVEAALKARDLFGTGLGNTKT